VLNRPASSARRTGAVLLAFAREHDSDAAFQHVREDAMGAASWGLARRRGIAVWQGVMWSSLRGGVPANAIMVTRPTGIMARGCSTIRRRAEARAVCRGGGRP